MTPKKPEPPRFPLDRFVERELQIGLETSTRVEVLSGLEDGDWVADDPQLLRRKLDERQSGTAAPDTGASVGADRPE